MNQPASSMTKLPPNLISWEWTPFSFRFDWIYDPEFGWLEFYWFSELYNSEVESGWDLESWR